MLNQEYTTKAQRLVIESLKDNDYLPIGSIGNYDENLGKKNSLDYNDVHIVVEAGVDSDNYRRKTFFVPTESLSFNEPCQRQPLLSSFIIKRRELKKVTDLEESHMTDELFQDPNDRETFLFDNMQI